MFRFVLACVTMILVPCGAMAEPPTGSWILATMANSNADGVSGPQLGLEFGARLPISRSVNLVFAGSAAHSPKIETGDGQIYRVMFDVEHHRGAWFGAVGVSHGFQETSEIDKSVWFTRLSIGREIGPVRLWAAWNGPKPSKDRAESLGLELEWRFGRGVLRYGLGWLRHRDGEGIRLSAGFGVDFGHRAK